MLKKIMSWVVCGGVAIAFGAGCNKSETKVDKPADKAEVKAADKTPGAPAVDPKAILVSVGNDKLTVGEADKQIKAMLGQNAGNISPEQMDAMMGRFRPQAAERFVMRSLLNQEADKRKIVVKDSDIDEAVAMIKERMPKDMTLETILEREKMTLAELRSNLTSEIRLKLLVESEVPTNTVASDEEINKFYTEKKENFVQPETVEARHILIMLDPKDTDAVKAEKKAKAVDLQKQLVAGADFAKLAKEHSADPGSKDNGGELGPFQRGKMVKEFEDAAFNQATNAIGPVVTTEYGYHIIQVTSHEASKTVPLAEVKEKLAAHLTQQKQKELFDGFMQKLKSAAKVTYSDLAKAQPEMPMMQMD